MTEGGNQERKTPTRRQVLCCAGGGVLGFAAGWFVRGHEWTSPASEARPENAQQALTRLREGNQRFVEGNVRHGHESRSWRAAQVADQHPFAVILGCSDSRVPIELVFDQGFGDLFVIRVAGNVISMDVLGSIGYAVAHLHTRLLLVMGHEGCGAVTAALQAQDAGNEPPNIAALVQLIGPGLRGLDPNLAGAARLSAAVEANVRWSMRQLAAQPAGQRLLESGQLVLAGAIYELETGRVRHLET
jgi:carbonic anhydrase